MDRLRLNPIEEVLDQVEEDITNISQTEQLIENDVNDLFSDPQGKLWEEVKLQDKFEKYTNFTETEFSVFIDV